MIYLTSQLVRSARFGTSGVNAFLHQSRNESGAEISLVAQNPGPIVRSSISLPPGGNRVEAYLDLLLQDPQGLPNLESALAEVQPHLLNDPAAEGLIRLSADNVARWYFAAQLDRKAVFEKLASGARAAFSPAINERLRVVAERSNERTRLRLDDATEQRLRRIHGADWPATPIGVSDEVAGDFAVYQGPILPHVIQVLTGLGLAHVRALGGIDIVDPAGKLLYTWPRSTAANAGDSHHPGRTGE